MPIIPTPTLRVRQLGDLVDAGDAVGDGLQTAAAGAQGAVNTVASAPGAAVGAASDRAMDGLVDHGKKQAANSMAKYTPMICAVVGGLLVIGIAFYFWRRYRKLKRARLSSENADGDIDRK